VVTCTEGTDIREPYPYRHFGYREIGKEKSRASTRELAKLRSCDKDFGVRPLVIALWSLGKGGAHA
jgi:hypothetical protein